VPFVVLSGSALLLGFLHGLGADHLMAIAALSVDGRGGIGRLRIVRTAFQFACGHTLLLGVGVAVALTCGWILPAALAGDAERVGGGVLVILGGAGFWSALSGAAYGHVHTERDGRSRWHFHFSAGTHSNAAHSHSPVPTALGAVFAVSSLRAIVMLAPMGTALTSMALPTALLLVLLFGMGILLSMSLFGVVLARVLSLRKLEVVGRAAGFVVASASMALGLYWIIRN
jgi:nickel/cobalt exporter